MEVRCVAFTDSCWVPGIVSVIDNKQILKREVKKKRKRADEMKK